mmetsp:Transcript_22641/g.52825  ORF Transcript_22641/g.52825 Transcript_22641/m.52825 type:complete len:272 (+) Transcript_22641:80-895(+)
MIPTVPHRMGGLHARKDPLLDDKPGSSKRKKATDGSDMVYYKETDKEKAERLAAEKKARKAAEKAERKGGKALVEEQLVLPRKADAAEDEPADPSSKRQKKAAVAPMIAPASTGRAGSGSISSSQAAMQAQLASFKDKLKSNSLPSEAEAAEKRKKEEFAAEIAAKAAVAEPEQKEEGSKPAVEDPDNPITFSQIWQEGDEQGSGDWLTGQGLKFHTTADKAFAMDSRRFKEAVEGQEGAENREALAEQARRRGEAKMAEFKHSKGVSAMR